MDYTQNLHLPQWEKTDRIMMDDFNEAMASIDAGVKAATDAAPRIVTGSYTGDGAETQFIPLDSQPQMLIVTLNGRTSQGNIMYGGVAYPGAPSEAVTLNETGFTARGSGSNFYRANVSGSVYHYVALYWTE